MKPDRLERFILDNKEGFGPPMPAPDVWDKIQKREPQKENLFNWKMVMSRAAAVAVIFISSYYFHEYRSMIKAKAPGQNATVDLAQQEPVYQEMEEAESYYSSQIKYKKNELFSLTEDSPELQKDINRDLSELDNILLELKADLKDNAANQEVIEAMMQNYMLKLEILEDMLKQIKPNNKQQNKNETTYSI